MSHDEYDIARTNPGAESSVASQPRNETADIAGAFTHSSEPDSRMLHPQLRRLLAGTPPDQTRVERFFSRNRFPLIEREAVTFVFHGEAEAVFLRHFMHGIPNGIPFARASNAHLWYLRLRLPPATRFEYKLDVVRGGEGAWINDPQNPVVATDPFGANSVGHSFGYAPPPWTRPDPNTPAGRIEELAIDSRAFAGPRRLRVYIPAGFVDKRIYPLVIIHDGEDYVAHADLTTSLDNLIHRGELPPFIAVLTQSPERNDEYTGDPRHSDFLTSEVLPVVRERFPLRRDPGGTVLMGASLGGVAALVTAFRYPGVYGALALKSGSFILDRSLIETRDPLFARIADLLDEVRGDLARLPSRVFISCGIYEGLIGQNRLLARLLSDQGDEVRLLETRDAHHWQNWRDQLRDSLSWTLPRGE